MGRRILVADDSSTIQKVIKIAFARYAIEIVEAGSYIEALSAVGRSTIDALILDASLPGARGPQDFAKILGEARGAPMLLLVGTYEAVDEGAFRQAGFQHFLKKPFESTDIVAMIDRLLGGELRTGGDATVGPVTPPLPGSGNRAQHATVFHSGGVEALAGRTREASLRDKLPFGKDRDRGAQPPPSGGLQPLSGGPQPTSGDARFGPPGGDRLSPDGRFAAPGSGRGGDRQAPPVAWDQGPVDEEDLAPLPTDQTRKGRRAYNPREDASGRFSADTDPNVTQPPSPPLSLELDNDPDATSPRRPAAREASPLPPIPAGTGFGGEPGARLRSGEAPRHRAGEPSRDSHRSTHPSDRDGRRPSQADDEGEGLNYSAEAFASAPPTRLMPPHSGTREGSEIQGSFQPHSGAAERQLGSDLKAQIAADLPAYVRQAVEDYCERHFKSVAREVIASELRRLADEKARQLVDN